MTGQDAETRTARQVTRAWVEEALERAIRHAARNGALPVEPGEDAVGAFAAFVDRARPIVCVATAFPHAERLVAEIVREHPAVQAIERIAAGEIDPWSVLETGGFDHETLLVIPFHEPVKIPAPERFLHRLTVTDNPVLVGCRHPRQLPEALRARVDVHLALEPLGAEGFDRVFERLFGAPPGDADGAGPTWRAEVEPGDLHLPARMGHSAAEAERWLRERVAARRAAQVPGRGPALDELFGMGEARRIARDMVEEIRAARQGRLAWRELDRGMLLAGPPGTGKTALARALAREADVHFVYASAAAWQQGEGLGSHLAEIRRTFEEARRHPPALVFLDEMDSLGSREKLDGEGDTYTRSVINFLLEQLDGFGERERLIVIGATNHPEDVDPALRRSGRLDQVVPVPFPTTAALAEIYRNQLRPFEAAGRLAEDVDREALGRLSFGLTGADVEQVVRGAARRARRRGDVPARVRHDDLLAELLRRPRLEGEHERLPEEALRQLAVHEAGHVLARLEGPSGGAEIAWVSIAPRSDGGIGHVAVGGEARPSVTRDDLLHEVRILLSGRAAERLCFGPEGVSDLSGRRGTASDLARASRLARDLCGRAGLSEHRLVWPDALGPAGRASLGADVESLLARRYDEASAALGARRALLDRIVRLLVEEQEIPGARIRELAAGGV